MNAANSGSERQSIDEILAAARARLDRIEPDDARTSNGLAVR